MKNYEGVFILKPKLTKEEIDSLAKEIQDPIEKGGGKIVAKEEWGLKKLAYAISKEREGVFLQIKFQIDPAMIQKLKDSYKLNSKILRCMIAKTGS